MCHEQAGRSRRVAPRHGKHGCRSICLRDGYYADSVSLAYYAILHAAKASLQLHIGREPICHSGLEPESIPGPPLTIHPINLLPL